jgi:hypothetical protein
MAIIRRTLIRLSDDERDAKNWPSNPKVLAGSTARPW